MSKEQVCTMCGATGHSAPACPWARTLTDPGLARVQPAPAQPKGQSKLSSLTEALFSTLVGLLIAMGATFTICWVYDIPMTWTNNFIITFWMTVVSIARQYVIRRMWNAEFWKGWVARWKYRKIDPELCCCGTNMGEGGSVCGHGGCRSAKEYAITQAVEGL